MEKDWGVNKKLLKVLNKQVEKIVAKKHRKDAIDILTNCTDKTIREFLHFALLENYNLACTCLDFATDKKTNKPLKNKAFGMDIEKEEDFEDFERASLEDFMDWEKNEELLIELEDWNHRCGDGCCYTYGVNIFVNGEQIEGEDGTSSHQLLTAVLNKLGYTNVKVEYK